MTEFLNMGGYGQFVWPAYLVVAVVLVGLVLQSRRFAKTTADELAALNPRARRQRQETADETQA